MKSRQVLVSLLMSLLLVAVSASAAFAQDLDTIANGLADDGVYVAPGLSVSDAEVGLSVSTIRNEGEQIAIAVLFDEPNGGATAAADALSDRLDGQLVLVIAEESVGYSGTLEEFGDIEMDDAIDASINSESDGDLLRQFTIQLTGLDPTAPATPDAQPQTAEPAASSPASSGGGGPGILFWLLLIGAGVIGFLWWRGRKEKAARPDGMQATPEELVEAKAKVQEQINAVANDIIEMEDEVRVSDIDQVDAYYQAAGATYTDVAEAFPEANSPQSLLDLANKLDEAIWQLDSAEAILDGKTPPAKPVPQTLPRPESREPVPSPSGSGLPPRPQYNRRPSRRSSYGGGIGGGGFMNILIQAGMAMMANRARSPQRTSYAPPRSTPAPQQFPQVPTKRSPIPTPSNPGGGYSPSSSGRASSTGRRVSRRTSSSRRGSTGRSRGGARRTRKRRR